jgi:uncharacterized protein (DUF885 family)
VRRRWPRVLAALLGGLLLAAAVFLVPTIWGKPWSIEHYYLRVLVEFALEHPMLLSYARVLEPYGLDFHSDDLEDFSVAAERRTVEQARAFLAGLRRYDRAEQTESQLLSTDVLTWFLELWIDGEPFLLHHYPVEQFQGLQSTLPDFMVNIHEIEDEGDARDYLARLSRFDTAFDQIIAGLATRADAGIVPPRFVLDAVREEIEGFVAPPPVENVLYTHFAEELDLVGDLSDARRRELRDAAEAAIRDTVHPAYRRLDAALAGLQERAGEEAGVWRLPDGDAYYRWALRYHTTTDLGPDEIHAIGLAQVERLREEMRATLREMGVPDADPAATVRALNRDERFLFPDTPEGRSRILGGYREIVADARERLPSLFGRLPAAPVEVHPVPDFKEEGSAGAYYNPPSFDGARPGVFYVNLRSVREIPRFGMRTLAYHEAIPGHHLQIALAMENNELPLFRRVIPFTAFIEGWALYAERLAAERGFHASPADRLGFLVAQMFRAVRLVVDTGIHARRWSREEAIAYMLANTGMPETDVVAEVERYIVTPGQACAYMLGQLRILALRERARERLGARFELAAFHDAVLGEGALPLVILERVVEDWIQDRLAPH